VFKVPTNCPTSGIKQNRHYFLRVSGQTRSGGCAGTERTEPRKQGGGIVRLGGEGNRSHPPIYDRFDASEKNSDVALRL